MHTIHRVLAACLAASLITSGAAAFGDTFVIDSSLSTITITGNVLGVIPIVAQTIGSNIGHFDGTINADVSGGNITFNSALANGLLQPGPQMPGIGGVAGSAPANVGLSIGPGLGTVAIRNELISVSSGPTPLVGGTTFDLTALTLTIVTGTLDYNVPSFSQVGTSDLSDTTGMPTSGTGTLVGDVLTIPVSVSFTFEISPGPPPQMATVNLLGQLVATRVVPEPGTIALFGLGTVAIVTMGYRRRRKKA